MMYSVIRRHTLRVAVDKLPAGLCTCTMHHAWTATACTYDVHLCEMNAHAAAVRPFFPCNHKTAMHALCWSAHSFLDPTPTLDLNASRSGCAGTADRRRALALSM